MRGCTCRGRLLCPTCTALAERAGVVAPVEAPGVSERAFQAAIVRLAKAHGYLAYFTHRSTKSPSGFPDLVLAKAGKPLLISECKVPGGQLMLQQSAWLEALSLAQGKEVAVWQPDDWPTIQAALRR